MQTLDVVLAGLRGTLLAACGVSVSGCTAASQQPTETKPETPSEVFTEKEPEREESKGALLCPDPTPVLNSKGQDTGYIRCSDGAINRESAQRCEVPVTAPACKGTEDSRSCDSAANCSEAPNGFCMS